VTTEEERTPEETLPTRSPTFVGPDLFNPPAHQGWISITPSFTLSGEYNDNIFLRRPERESDFIFGFTPGLTLSMEKPSYRLLAGYNTSAEVFVDNTDLSDFGKRHEFFTDLFYRISPTVTFTLRDRFIYGQASNAVSVGGVSAGRQDSFRNTLVPRLRWQATPTTALSFFGLYTVLRYDDSDSNSDTYRLGVEAERQFTPRLTGLLGGTVAFMDLRDEEDAWTYTPYVGVSYLITPTLRATVRGGGTVIDRKGEDTEITPSWLARLTQTFKFGTIGIGYERTVAAEANGLSDRQIIFGSVLVPTLVRGLQLGFLPRYSIVDREGSSTSSKTDVDTLTLTLRATYQIARNISLIGSYTFFYQKEDRRGSTDEFDQNRVFFGVQYAYPITIY
jgi:hypothetical protein